MVTLPDKASEWLIALRERPDDLDLKNHFDLWLLERPENRQDWEEMSRLSDLISRTQPVLRDKWEQAPTFASLELQPDPHEDESRYGRVSPEVVEASRWSRRMGRVAITLVVLLVLATGVRFFPTISASHSTLGAEVEEVELADGSVVTLAPDSSLRVSFENGLRRVELLSGKVFFDVKPDPSRPFVVKAGELETQVLGTSFELESRAGEFALSVLEGLVRVRGDAVDSQLQGKPFGRGEWLTLSAAGALKRGFTDPDKIASWRQRLLFVKNEPLEKVVSELDTYFKGIIMVRGGKLKQERVSGVYSLKTPEQALQAIALSHDAELYRLSPWVLVLVQN